MNREDAGRLAFGIAIGVVGALAITRSDLSPRDAILRWLIFSLVAGVIVNTQDGKKGPYLLGAAALSSLGLVGTVLWLALLGEGVIPDLSGVRVDLIHRLSFSATLLFGLLFTSAFSVFVCAFARPIILGLLHKAMSIEVERAKRIEQLLNVVVKIVGTVSLLLFSIL